MSKLLSELSRRHVFRVAAAYVVVAWIVLQLGAILFATFEAPGWVAKVFTTLMHWRKEFRLYRRDEKGKIVKENDHLMDAKRYLVNTPSVFSTKPIQHARRRSSGEW